VPQNTNDFGRGKIMRAVKMLAIWILVSVGWQCAVGLAAPEPPEGSASPIGAAVSDEAMAEA